IREHGRSLRTARRLALEVNVLRKSRWVLELPLLLSACSNNLFSGSKAKKGMEAIKARLGYPDPLFSRLRITKDRIEAYGQHPKNPSALTQVFYDLKDDSVGFGGNVKIQGGGTAQDIGFKMSSLDFSLVPKMVEQVKSKTSNHVWLLQISHGYSSAQP